MWVFRVRWWAVKPCAQFTTGVRLVLAGDGTWQESYFWWRARRRSNDIWSAFGFGVRHFGRDLPGDHRYWHPECLGPARACGGNPDTFCTFTPGALACELCPLGSRLSTLRQ